MEIQGSNYFKVIKSIIKSRKSIRNFFYQEIDSEKIKEILECGRWAPSGRNSQPWKVFVVTHPTVKNLVAEHSKYKEIIESASVNLVVFLDLERGYDKTKDVQAIGAFIQNILLAIHAMDLGAVWIGEILNQKEEINKVFKLDIEKFELMGVIALGIIDNELEEKKQKPRERRSIDEFTEWY